MRDTGPTIATLQAEIDFLDAELMAIDADLARLRAVLKPLACNCDRANGDACSLTEIDCPFWQARLALKGRT